jgi:hypothetical protein
MFSQSSTAKQTGKLKRLREQEQQISKKKKTKKEESN